METRHAHFLGESVESVDVESARADHDRDARGKTLLDIRDDSVVATY